MMRTAAFGLACILFATAASAQDANALKQTGDQAMDAKRYAEALDAYERANALSPNPVFDYNRGRALEFLGRYPEAIAAYERFQSQASPQLKARVAKLDDLLRQLRAKVSTVNVHANVPGRLLIGGKDMGNAPATNVRVTAGKTTIEVMADGYFPFRRDIDLAGGRTTDIEANLAARDVSGYLVVRSSVAESTVLVDGRGIGLVPTETVLPAGTHPVRVEHDGFNPAESQVVLHAGERREIVLDPIVRHRAITSRWWFWTGIVAVVVAGAAVTTIVALTTERAAQSGNFSPGQVHF
jgi:hypothetical protein